MKTNQRKFKQGQFLLHQNEKSRHMFIVNTGTVKIYRKDGEHITFSDVVKSGGVVGALSLIDGLPRNFTAECETEVVATVISAEDFDVVNKEISPWIQALSRSLAHRLRASVNKVERNVDSFLRSSIISLLIYYAYSKGVEYAYVREELLKELEEVLRAPYTKINEQLDHLVSLGYLVEKKGVVLIKDLGVLEQLSQTV